MSRGLVVGVGLVMADVVVHCDRFPSPETDPKVSNVTLRPGGSTANILRGLRKLGYRAGLLGAVGADPMGSLLLQNLAADGIDVGHIAVTDTATATCVVLEAPDERTLLWHQPEKQETGLRPSEQTIRFLTERAIAIHVNGRFPAVATQMCRSANAIGRTVSLNLGRGDVSRHAAELMQYADVVVSSDDFARAHTGIRDIGKASARLAEQARPAAVVTVTAGARGSWTAANGRVFHTPTQLSAAEVRRTSGAGDSFHAAFLAAHLEGADPEQAAKSGADEAARHCAAHADERSPLIVE